MSTPESDKGRRSFLGTLVTAISAVVGAVMAAPLLRFAYYPVSHGDNGAEWFPLARADSLATVDEPIRAEVDVRKRDGWRVTQSKQTVWITRGEGGKLAVLSAICPHLGCVVPWSAEKKMFACPCHNGYFGKDGSRVSGPPPRGLDVLPSKIEGGTLYVKYEHYRQLVAKREVIG